METSGNANLPVEAADDALRVRRVFGEAYEADGALVIPVAKVFGGSGMGYGDGAPERPQEGGGSGEAGGGGGGFGVRVKPLGVYVVREGKVSWQPALDLNRVILGGQLVGALALLVLARVVRTRRR